MGNFKQKIEDFIGKIQDGMYAVQSVYRKEGLNVFKAPILVIILMPFIIWTFMYRPSVRAYRKNLKVISSIEAQKRYGRDFAKLQDEIIRKESMLPDSSEKSDWLSKTIRKTCAEHGITIQSMAEQQESLLGEHYIVASTAFKFYSNFNSVAKLIESLENTPYFIMLSQVEISKSPGKDDLGRVSVSITVETVFSKKKLTKE